MSSQDRYAFTDSKLAERRLAALADAFSGSTRSFLLDAIDGPINLIVDLGCGPGHTTHLIAETVDCERVIGLDASSAFIKTALQGATERASFRQHDVTVTPFPDGPADVIYCRLLLTHLGDPEPLLSQWATQLTPNGRLLVEEVEEMRTTNEVLVSYIGIVETLLAHQDNDLYLGRELGRLDHIDGLALNMNRMRALEVPEFQAASMFRLNIRVWKNNDFIKSNYEDAFINDLEQKLDSMAANRDALKPVVWQWRQMVFQRHPATS